METRGELLFSFWESFSVFTPSSEQMLLSATTVLFDTRKTISKRLESARVLSSLFKNPQNVDIVVPRLLHILPSLGQLLMDRNGKIRTSAIQVLTSLAQGLPNLLEFFDWLFEALIAAAGTMVAEDKKGSAETLLKVVKNILKDDGMVIKVLPVVSEIVENLCGILQSASSVYEHRVVSLALDCAKFVYERYSPSFGGHWKMLVDVLVLILEQPNPTLNQPVIHALEGWSPLWTEDALYSRNIVEHAIAQIHRVSQGDRGTMEAVKDAWLSMEGDVHLLTLLLRSFHPTLSAYETAQVMVGLQTMVLDAKRVQLGVPLGSIRSLLLAMKDTMGDRHAVSAVKMVVSTWILESPPCPDTFANMCEVVSKLVDCFNVHDVWRYVEPIWTTPPPWPLHRGLLCPPEHPQAPLEHCVVFLHTLIRKVAQKERDALTHALMKDVTPFKLALLHTLLQDGADVTWLWKIAVHFLESKKEEEEEEEMEYMRMRVTLAAALPCVSCGVVEAGPRLAKRLIEQLQADPPLGSVLLCLHGAQHVSVAKEWILPYCSHADVTVRYQAIRALSAWCADHVADESIQQLCIVRLWDSDGRVCRAVMELMCIVLESGHLPVRVDQRAVDSKEETGDESLIHNVVLQTKGNWRTALLRGRPSGMFRGVHFSRIVDDILCNQLSRAQCLRLFHMCQSSSLLGNEMDSNDIHTSTAISMWWCIWEAARYCMLTRLRTPLGGEVATLSVVEKGFAQSNASATHVSLWVMMQFFDALDKQLFAAYEGGASLPMAPKKSVQFFVKNRSTMTEWLQRVLPNIVRIAQECGATIPLLVFCSQRLKSLWSKIRRSMPGKRLFQHVGDVQVELERVLLLLMGACIEAHDDDLVVGWAASLQSVVEETGGTCWSKALHGVFFHSSGRLEAAVADYVAVLADKAPVHLIEFCAFQAAQCHATLADWNGMHAILEEYNVMHADHLRALAAVSRTWELPKDSPELDEATALAASLLDRLPPVTLPVVNAQDALRCSEQCMFSFMAGGEGGDLLTKAAAVLREPLQVGLGESQGDVSLLHLQLICVHALRMPSPKKAAQWLVQRMKTSEQGIAAWTKVVFVTRFLDQENACVLMEQGAALARSLNNLGLCKRWLEGCVVNIICSTNFFRTSAKLEQIRWEYDQGETSSAIQSLVQMWKQEDVNVNVALQLASWMRHAPQVGHDVEGVLLEATQRFPKSMEAWLDCARWLYRQARAQAERISSQGGVFELLKEETKAIEDVLEELYPPPFQDLLGALCTVIGRYRSCGSSRKGDVLLRSKHEQNIRKAMWDLWKNDAGVDRLMEVWRSVRQRVMSLVNQAASAYFQFLQLHQSSEKNVSVYGEEVVATLRLLRLLVQYGEDVCPVFEKELDATPLQPWEDIIPQMFARLDHDEPRVAQLLSRLIVRIAQKYPHVVVYPALAAAGPHAGPARVAANKAALCILDELRHHAPLLVQGVEQMSTALNDMSSLWEEKWVETLHRLSFRVTKRLVRLKAEARRVLKNDRLDAQAKERIMLDKYTAMTRPAVTELEVLLDGTVRTAPTTKHERWFVSSFGERLENAVASFSHPKDPNTPEGTWKEMDAILMDLQKMMRGTALLSVGDVSPALVSAATSNTVPVPGLHSEVSMVEIEPKFAMLSTKTRPKRFTVRGSDGRLYKYLLKGKEDLHLDERIMQFLTAVNRFLLQSNQARAHHLRAVHYAVTPLGRFHGLIQWVQRTVPLYTLFKMWRKRSLQRHEMIYPDVPRPDAPLAVMLSPNELFWRTLRPLLAERGVGEEDRSKWPVEMMRRAYGSLVHHIPADILSRELWMSSADVGCWWRKARTYAHSTAVMSVVGYVLGLGDRHLDNIVVCAVSKEMNRVQIDMETGEVVHIDYNVCFEKGERLRVPETVPFRLTHIMRDALGSTDVEGPFRNAAGRVLRVLRRSREQLLLLLDAFVYDPLVDWTAYTDPSGLDREAMELDVRISLFSSRVDELRPHLTQGHNNLQRVLSFFRDALESALSFRVQYGEDRKEEERVRELLDPEEATLAQLRHQLDQRAEQRDQLQSKRMAQKNEAAAAMREIMGMQRRARIQQDQLAQTVREVRSNAMQMMKPLLLNPTTVRERGMVCLKKTVVDRGAIVPSVIGTSFVDNAHTLDGELEEVLSDMGKLVRTALDGLNVYRNHLVALPKEYASLTSPRDMLRTLDVVCDALKKSHETDPVQMRSAFSALGETLVDIQALEAIEIHRICDEEQEKMLELEKTRARLHLHRQKRLKEEVEAREAIEKEVLGYAAVHVLVVQESVLHSVWKQACQRKNGGSEVRDWPANGEDWISVEDAWHDMAHILGHLLEVEETRDREYEVLFSFKQLALDAVYHCQEQVRQGTELFRACDALLGSLTKYYGTAVAWIQRTTRRKICSFPRGPYKGFVARLGDDYRSRPLEALECFGASVVTRCVMEPLLGVVRGVARKLLYRWQPQRIVWDPNVSIQSLFRSFSRKEWEAVYAQVDGWLHVRRILRRDEEDERLQQEVGAAELRVDVYRWSHVSELMDSTSAGATLLQRKQLIQSMEQAVSALHVFVSVTLPDLLKRYEHTEDEIVRRMAWRASTSTQPREQQALRQKVDMFRQQINHRRQVASTHSAMINRLVALLENVVLLEQSRGGGLSIPETSVLGECQRDALRAAQRARKAMEVRDATSALTDTCTDDVEMLESTFAEQLSKVTGLREHKEELVRSKRMLREKYKEAWEQVQDLARSTIAVAREESGLLVALPHLWPLANDIVRHANKDGSLVLDLAQQLANTASVVRKPLPSALAAVVRFPTSLDAKKKKVKKPPKKEKTFKLMRRGEKVEDVAIQEEPIPQEKEEKEEVVLLRENPNGFLQLVDTIISALDAAAACSLALAKDGLVYVSSREEVEEAVVQEEPVNVSYTCGGTRILQLKNTYAMNVLKRVKSKLEGYVNDDTCVDVEDQVKHIIDVATNPDNLCRMYEGWMPWV